MHARKAMSSPIDYLGSNEKLARLMSQAHELSRLDADCTRILPAWFSNCHAVGLENGILVLSVPNQTKAARIKLNIPLLQEKLVQKGWPITSIRLKIRFLPPEPEKPSRQKTAVLPESARESFAGLCQRLEAEDPDSPVVAALKKLIRNT